MTTETAPNELFEDGRFKKISWDQQALRNELRFQLQTGPTFVTTVGAELELNKLPAYESETNYDAATGAEIPFATPGSVMLAQRGQSRTVFGGYLENVARLPYNIKLIVGGRYDAYSDFGTAISPRTGLIWRRGAVTLKGFYGQAFRAPTFQELYDQSGALDAGGYVGNESLDASRIRTFDGGAFLAHSFQRLLVNFGVNGFYSKIRDSIDRAPLVGSGNLYQNSSDVDSFGGAVELRLSYKGRHSLFGNASWFSANSDYSVMSGTTAINSQTDLVSVPPLRANLGARVGVTRDVSLGAFMQYGDARKNNERTPLEKVYFFSYPSYVIYSLAATWNNLLPGTRARLFVENLTSEKVADEPFRGDRMPQGVPRDLLRTMLMLEHEL
jgi:iron complex outermembrane receptor protein